MDYENLSLSEKRKISLALNLKHNLENAKDDFEKASENIFEIVKEKGKIIKEKEKISFVPEGESDFAFNEDDFAKDYPKLYAKYLTKEVKGKKAYLRYSIK